MVALGLSSDAGLLDAGRIGGLFEAVNAGLGGLSVRAPVEVVVVGVEAVAMQWNQRRVTYDVDVVSEGIPAVFWDVVAGCRPWGGPRRWVVERSGASQLQPSTGSAIRQ